MFWHTKPIKIHKIQLYSHYGQRCFPLSVLLLTHQASKVCVRVKLYKLPASAKVKNAWIHTYIHTQSIDPSSVQDGMNMKLVTKKKGKERKGRRGR